VVFPLPDAATNILFEAVPIFTIPVFVVKIFAEFDIPV
jgi:hypothetical protein